MASEADDAAQPGEERSVELPDEVGLEEFVERAVDKAHVVRGTNELSWRAIRLSGKEAAALDQGKEAGPSIFRALGGANECKRAAKAARKAYVGLAEAKAGRLEELGHHVTSDRSPEDSPAHGEIHFLAPPARVEAPRGKAEEASPERDAEQRFYESLIGLFVLKVDEEPDAGTWAGPALGTG